MRQSCTAKPSSALFTFSINSRSSDPCKNLCISSSMAGALSVAFVAHKHWGEP